MKKILIVSFLLVLCFWLNATNTAIEATWTTSEETVNGQDYFIAYTSTAVTTACQTVYTEPTDFKLNWDAPIMVIINPDGDDYDTTTLPVKMYCGYSGDFDVTVTYDGTATIVDGWEFGTVEADVYTTTGQVRLYGFPPTLADDTTNPIYSYFLPPCPELAFSITAPSEFSASTVEIIIMQPMNLNIPEDWHSVYGGD